MDVIHSSTWRHCFRHVVGRPLEKHGTADVAPKGGPEVRLIRFVAALRVCMFVKWIQLRFVVMEEVAENQICLNNHGF